MRWPPYGRRSWIGLAVLAGLGIVAAGASVAYRGRPLKAASAPEAKPEEATAPSASSITLSEEKLKHAGLRIEVARRGELPVEVVVPGRIEADVDRRIDIRPRVAGVIRSVKVAIGQKVEAGDLLLTLDSAEVGTARLDLRNRQRELTIARTEADWRSTIAANVEAIIKELRRDVPAATLEREYASKPLGNDRALLLSAYSDLQIAQHEEEKQTDLHKKKIVGEHMAFLAIHSREGAQAKFEAALEQVRYDAARRKRLADQQVRVAESATIDAAQHLRILGIPVDIDDLVKRPDAALDSASGADEDLTAYPIVAPFDGTIIARSAVASQRAEPTDVLLGLADLRKVRVSAHIAESDFSVLPTLGTGSVRVTAAAYPGRVYRARVLDVGAVVDPTTRTVTLLAEADNDDALLKLGMFVRVSLDSPRAEAVVIVPDAAVVEVDGRNGVFVPAKDGRTFRLRPVTLGREVEGRRAIAAGLPAGERVVTAGAFGLKSELLLQLETDEE